MVAKEVMVTAQKAYTWGPHMAGVAAWYPSYRPVGGESVDNLGRYYQEFVDESCGAGWRGIVMVRGTELVVLWWGGTWGL